MNLEVELIAGVLKGGPPPAHLPAPRLIKIFIACEREGKFYLIIIVSKHIFKLTIMHCNQNICLEIKNAGKI